MASQEQLELSDFIKSVHENLRRDAETLGAKDAWNKHCGNKKTLKKYANVMHSLATNHWEKAYVGEHSKNSRVIWTVNACQDYFLNGQLFMQQDKEYKTSRHFGLSIPSFTEGFKPPFKLLDVGSCYNPFKVFDCFDVLAVDIAPATTDVVECDFLNLKIISEEVVTSNNVKTLQKNSVHIVVFSLFLEYLPSPPQRLVCCQKAYELLKPEGVLVIVTPDSKHVGANAKFMRSWMYILARLGFSRIKYEKLPHLHCMMFRKSIDKSVALKRAELDTCSSLFTELFIPQDFKNMNDLENISNQKHKHHLDNTPYIDIENELPFYIDD